MTQMALKDLIRGIEDKNGFPLDQPQKDAIAYGSGPLLIAAGPGTGKTEVLVARVLKFMCCDSVAPGSIMLTTFTEKAAQNLEDRLEEGFAYLAKQHPQIATIDTAEIRVGTLHALCNQILQENRYTAYQNYRLLDELESALLINKSVAERVTETDKKALLSHFPYLFGKNKLAPSRWDWALALMVIFNRLIEDQIDLATMQTKGDPWKSLYQAHQIHEQALADSYACDFAHLLQHFREFLDSSQSTTFLKGSQDDFKMRPPLSHVLVDEYQDTNPIQESIYLRLCDTIPHNITVVGDDDQALYRFRGGTVECMVGFDVACQARWSTKPCVIYLVDNHRSDDDIVRWCNNYIDSFPVMRQPNVRIAGKPTLRPASARPTGTHPALGLIRRPKVSQCAGDFAALVRDLRANRVVQDYSQCVLLLPSTKNSPKAAGPYLQALQLESIPVYNPRSRDYQEQEEVAQALGAFIRIVDPELNHLHKLHPNARARQLVQAWVNAYDAIVPSHPELSWYVANSAAAIQKMGTQELITPDTPTILYRIFAHQPFVTYQNNPEQDLRLSKLTRLLEAFCASYQRQLWTSKDTKGELSFSWYGNLYYGVGGYIAQRGIDDDEDQNEICPTGSFPIMTIHQAKGLEFDFVFAGNLGRAVTESKAHQLEHDLRPFRRNQPTVTHSISDAKWHDAIRQQFVAYSRAKHALILIATDTQLGKKGNETAAFGGQGGGWVLQNALRL